MKNIADMTTAEMVAEYNNLTGKSIKKFSSRAAGEKQLAAARPAMKVKLTESVDAKDARKDKEQREAKKNPAPAWPFAGKKAEEKKAYSYKTDGCPACGETEDQTAAGLDGTVAGDEQNLCHCCGAKYDRNTGKILKQPKKSTNRADAISQTWADASVRDKRVQRNGCSVEGKGKFKSVREAFAQLHLPMQKHIKFRMELKAAGKATFGKFEFKLA